MALGTSRRNLIGFAAPEPGRARFGHWFAREIWQGIADAVEEHGQDLLYLGRSSEDRMMRDGSGLLSIEVDGFIFMVPPIDAPALRLLQKHSIPFVTICGQANSVHPTFGCDNEGGIRQALSFLRQQGHTRIAHIAGPASLEDGVIRESAYRNYMAEKHLEVPSGFVQRGGFVYEGGYAAAQSLLRMPYRPTAILAANDPMAYGVIAAAHDLGIEVPNELSVIGFDDEYHASMTRPPLTTVRQPAREVAQEAVSCLAALINGATDVKGRLLPTELVVRESTAPVPI